MEKQTIKKVLDAITNLDANKGNHIIFSEKDIEPIPFSKDFFKKIPLQESNNSKIVFIDGGNAEIISSQNMSLQLIKVYYTIYQNNKRIKNHLEEFTVLVHSTTQENQLYFSVESFDTDLIFKGYSALDPTIMQGQNRINISKIGELVRKLAEIRISALCINELENGDIIVMDGNLKPSATYEEDSFNELFSKAYDKGIIITAISKTSELFTNTGYNGIIALQSIAPKEEWSYSPICKNNSKQYPVEFFITKLHRKSSHVFKLEAFNKQKELIQGILPLLRDNSTDPVFVGYPYGLIEAHNFAKVQKKDIESEKLMILASSGEKQQIIENNISSTNSHDILDNI